MLKAVRNAAASAAAWTLYRAPALEAPYAYAAHAALGVPGVHTLFRETTDRLVARLVNARTAPLRRTAHRARCRRFRRQQLHRQGPLLRPRRLRARRDRRGAERPPRRRRLRGHRRQQRLLHRARGAPSRRPRPGVCLRAEPGGSAAAPASRRAQPASRIASRSPTSRLPARTKTTCGCSCHAGRRTTASRRSRPRPRRSPAAACARTPRFPSASGRSTPGRSRPGQPRIDLMKIDVEGAEAQVLAGMSATFARLSGRRGSSARRRSERRRADPARPRLPRVDAGRGPRRHSESAVRVKTVPQSACAFAPRLLLRPDPAAALLAAPGLPWTVHDEVVRIDPRARHLVPHEPRAGALRVSRRTRFDPATSSSTSARSWASTPCSPPAGAVPAVASMAFEPTPSSAALARRHLAFNGLGPNRVSLIEAAVSDRAARATLHQYDDSAMPYVNSLVAAVDTDAPAVTQRRRRRDHRRGLPRAGDCAVGHSHGRAGRGDPRAARRARDDPRAPPGCRSSSRCTRSAGRRSASRPRTHATRWPSWA